MHKININKRGNPFIIEGMMILHNFTTGQIVPTDNPGNILNFLNHGLTDYQAFRCERFIDKDKKLSEDDLFT